MSLDARSIARPAQFYDDWTAFCTHVLSQRIRAGGDNDDAVVVILAGGAILGTASLLLLVAENRAAIDAKGAEWGVPKLSAFATLGTAVVGTVGAGLLIRTLGRHVDASKVDALQSRLATARRDFELLARDRQEKRIDQVRHHAAVDRIFVELTHPASH